MRGTILDYDGNTQKGLISGDDGNRYVFAKNEWRSHVQPQGGQRVDFTPVGERAGDIYYLERPFSLTSSKRIPAVVFSLLLGALGIHKFYLGYTQAGIIMLLCTIPGVLLFGIPTIIVGTIALIEGIIYACKSDEEFERIYVQGRRPWF
ncbi:TM2 domain-containing protein [Cardiobacterium hominis]|jgi:TM2 domain containing protein|uniref:TM2 domain-containing protein n=1 Tax=Cardiobacterium hominis TaxID=2718 RepID=UPI0028E666DE|nr:TM2 domain-containing protein [Cardiobacterium hominis]